MSNFKNFVLDDMNEAKNDFTTMSNVVKFVRENMINQTFRKGANVQYSKKHGGYLYSAKSKIDGITFETGWSHQDYTFYIMFDKYTDPKIKAILDQFIADNSELEKDDNNFYLSETRTSANPYFKFDKRNRFSRALCEELEDSITGYSQDDL